MSSPPLELSTYFEQWQKFVPQGGFMFADAHINHPARITYTKLISDCSKTVLDVGCGVCVDYSRFHNANVEYFGLDITPKYLEMANTKFGVPKNHLFLGNILALPFSDLHFDSVYENGMLEHLPPETWRQAVEEMVRVSKKQVILVFFIPLCKEQTIYQKQAAWQIFWGHQYGEVEITSFLSSFNLKIEVMAPINSLTNDYPPETIVVATK